MFRPNRIGTPNLTGAWRENADDLLTTAVHTAADPAEFVVVNAIPWMDYGSDTVMFTGNTTALPAGELSGIGQQFNIPTPIAGDAVGVELIGTAYGWVSTNLSFGLLPYACQLVAPGEAEGDVVVSNQLKDAFLADISAQQIAGGASGVLRVVNWKTQIIFDNLNGPLTGTFLHGVRVHNVGSVATAIEDIWCTLSVRQLNDQQDIGYRDTRR